MGFNRRKMEDQRRETAEKEAASRRATDAQVLEDAEHLIAAADDTDTTMSVAVTVTAEAACPYRKSKDLTSVDQRHERSPFQSGKAAAVVHGLSPFSPTKVKCSGIGSQRHSRKEQRAYGE